MANEERTESATPKRREKERDKGNIAKSQDFTSSLMLTLGVGLLYVLSSSILEKIQSLLYQTFTHLDPQSINESNPMGIFVPYAITTGQILAPFLFFLCIGAVLILRLQTGALFAKEALKPNLERLMPANMIKMLLKKFNFFEPKTMMELVKSLAKLTVVGLVGFNVINKRKGELFATIGMDVNTSFAVVGSVITELIVSICIILVIIGIIDKKFQDYQYEKSIKMTKQEVKDEWKNLEGDPKIKSKVRAFQMQIMQQKMMSSVKQADVVVVNPTHYAVAIKYDPQNTPVPQVLAKGVDFLAFKIREIAKNNNIPIVENRPLAQSLYKLVPIGGIIPQELYVAVAEVLRFVYSAKGK